MSKRFTDTEKWKDEWYLSLSNDSRIIWQYILDNCTHAGILKKNFKLLNFCCATTINQEQFNIIFKDRVVDFGGFYLITKFLKFQYPQGLNSEKPAIVSVRRELLSYNTPLLLDVIKESLGNDYLIVKDKDKDKDKNKDKGGYGGKSAKAPEISETSRKVAEWKAQWEKENPHLV